MAGGKFTSFGASLGDLDAAWHDRLNDAHVLLEAGRHATALAMGLYSLEILLKTLICRKLDLTGLPEPFKIHNLQELLILSGLSNRINGPEVLQVKQNWDALTSGGQQIDQLRYSPNDRWTIEQVQDLFQRLTDPTDGVIPWLSAQT